MTERVDFYVLESTTPKQRWTFACRLTEKAYLRDLRILVLSGTAADAEVIDEMLWTFNERSFVPHVFRRHDRPVDAATPVQITVDLDATDQADLLVNLTARLPVGLQRFPRIAEIIDADDERRRSGRERFRAYRELDLPVETHRLDDELPA